MQLKGRICVEGSFHLFVRFPYKTRQLTLSPLPTKRMRLRRGKMPPAHFYPANPPEGFSSQQFSRLSHVTRPYAFPLAPPVIGTRRWPSVETHPWPIPFSYIFLSSFLIVLTLKRLIRLHRVSVELVDS